MNSIISLQLYRNCADACFVFKCLTGRVPNYLTSKPLSSTEASLCCWHAGEKEKGSTRGTMGHDRPPRGFYFFDYYYFYRDTQRKTAEERASKLVTRGQLFGRVIHNSQQLFIPLFKTAAGQRLFQHRVVSLWNSLDKDLKLSKNRRDFKQKLTQILLHKFLDPSSVS